MTRGAKGGGAGVHLRCAASEERFLDVLDLREDDNVAVVVDVHLFNTEVEGVAGSKRNRADGIVTTKRAPQDIADASALSRLEVQLHLVQPAAQFHLVRNVVIDVEHLRFPIAAVGHQEFDIQVVAFVEIVS